MRSRSRSRNMPHCTTVTALVILPRICLTKITLRITLSSLKKKDNFKLFELVARRLEVQFFEEQLEKLKTTTNDQSRQWLRGLLREREKWSRVYDHGGWRWEFQTSNMAKLLPFTFADRFDITASAPSHHQCCRSVDCA